MSVPEDSSAPKPAHGFDLVRIGRLILLVVLGVGGYVAIQLAPGWFQFFSGPGTAPLYKQAGVVFVELLLIAYPVALLGSLLGTVVLIDLRARARSRARREGSLAASRRPLQARLLLLCVSILLSLAVLEAGAAAWRSWLHQSPALGSPPRKIAGDVSRPGPEKAAEPRLPSWLSGQETNQSATATRLRILVIGESSGRGEPYHPWLSVGQIVAWRLEKVFPGRSIQVDIWATGGATLEAMHKKLAGLTYRPDALIVYVGHNEFQGRYSCMREVDHYLDDDRVPQRLARLWGLASILRFSPLHQLLDETRERQRLDSIPPRMVTRELVDRPGWTRAESKAIEDDFRRRLESIAGYGESIGTLPIFIIPAGNDAGWEPSRSVLAAETPRAERVAFAREVVHARALEEKAPAEAIRINRALVNRHPEFAETHFRLARLLEQTGHWEEARDHYVQARERDGLPLRCPEPLREAYREVAARHPSVLLVDGPKVLEARSRHGILDGRFFHDAQHPNLQGYVALSEDLLIQLHARRAFGWPVEKPVPAVDPEVCARHFDINPARWTEICKRDNGFFRASAYVRYDPEFRNERAAEYLRAGAAIREGRAPADAGIPGWAMPPPPSSSHRIPPARIRRP